MFVHDCYVLLIALHVTVLSGKNKTNKMKVFYLISSLILLLPWSFFVSGQAGSWKVLKTKTEVANRGEFGMVAVNGKLYLIGGGSGGPQAVESFDPGTLQWKKLATAPLLMHHFQAVAYNNNIYVLEAFSGGDYPNQVPMSNVYFYDTKKDKWQMGGEMPAARRRAGAGAAAYKAKLYLVAGIQHGHASGTTNIFDMYDPETGIWTPLPDAPHIRDHCSAAIVKDKLYVVGGRNTSFRDPANKITFYSETVLEVDCYDFLTGKWSTLPANLPLGSGGGAVVNLKDVLYYMGGERATDTQINAPRKNTYYLDPSTQNQWTETDSLQYARNGMAAAVLSDRIYAAGGSGGSPGGPGYHLISNNTPSPSLDTSIHDPVPQSQPTVRKENNLTIEVFSLK